MAENTSKPRRIRSYVLRQGRLTRGQAAALEKHWRRYGIEFNRAPLDLDRVFHRHAPRILDIGTGMGETTVALARKHPENDYLAVEVHRPGVGSLIRQAVAADLDNLRVINHDVVDILRYQVPLASMDEIYLFFPDPWPKKRHRKRRLITPAFISLLAARMKDHARLFMASDWQDMAEQALAVCDGDGGLINLAGRGNYAPRPQWRPETKFEARGRGLDHPVWDLVYCRAGS